MCAQRMMTDWLKILRIAGELGASDIETQTVHIVNGTRPLADRDCVRLALALQLQIERKQAALINSPMSLRQLLATDPNERLQQDVEFAWHRQRSGEASVVNELQHLSQLFDELQAVIKSRVSTSVSARRSRR